jgi:hypothetical protein
MFQIHLKKYAPGFDTLRFSRLTADWPVENMNNDVTSYGMSLCITQKKTTSILLSHKKGHPSYKATFFIANGEI